MTDDEPGVGNFDEMYKNLMDPDAREARKAAVDRKKRREDRMADTGAYVVAG